MTTAIGMGGLRLCLVLARLPVSRPGQKPGHHQIVFHSVAVMGQMLAEGSCWQTDVKGRMRTAVFDLDGTLADTSADLIRAANATLEEAGFGRPLSARSDIHHAFRGGRAMLRTGLSRAGNPHDMETLVDRLYPLLLEHYRREICTDTRLYDGADVALDQLAADGWRLAICTNKPISLADTLLDKLGVASRFRAVLGADSLAVRKPHPDHVLETIARAGGTRAGAVMIGDTETDRAAATNAGIPCVLVGFGPEGGGVSRLKPDAVLGHYRDLPGVLEDILQPARRAV
jgi:phosphoglycolate phosphatase